MVTVSPVCRISLLGLVLCAATNACWISGTNNSTHEESIGSAAKKAPVVNVPVVNVSPFEEVDLLLGSTGAVPASTPRTFAEQRTLLRQFIDERLQQDRVYDQLVPKLIDIVGHSFAGIFGSTQAPFVLKSQSLEDTTFYYLRDDVCSAEELVEVAPWWDLANPVKICPESYRPQIDRDPKLGVYCETKIADQPDSACGCGPNLINCFRDNEQEVKAHQAIISEVVRTVQHVIETEQPFKRIFEIPETMRPPLADFFYERQKFLIHGKWSSLEAVDETGEPRLKERPEWAQAGIFTTPLVLNHSSGWRMTLAEISSNVVCLQFRSSNVETHQMFSLNESASFRHEGQSPLATMTGCENCHARLESAVTAMSGWTPFGVGRRYIPSNTPKGTIKYFHNDHTDMRAEGPADIRWFMSTMAEQPEFQQCMVAKVEELIYQGTAVPTLEHRLLSERFSSGGNMKQLISDALLLRLLGPRGISEAEAPR